MLCLGEKQRDSLGGLFRVFTMQLMVKWHIHANPHYGISLFEDTLYLYRPFLTGTSFPHRPQQVHGLIETSIEHIDNIKKNPLRIDLITAGL